MYSFREISKPWIAEEGDYGWLEYHNKFLNVSQNNRNNIKAVFLGASICHSWTEEGKQIWDKHYASRGAYNYGIPGDTTQNVLWRIINGEFDSIDPKVLVLLVGTNNIFTDDPEDVVLGITEIINTLRIKLKDTKIISIGITAINDMELNRKIDFANSNLENNADNENVFFLNINKQLVGSNGRPKPELFTDGMHLSREGYVVWDQAMRPLFDRLFKTV